jgi:hypothetical protein
MGVVPTPTPDTVDPPRTTKKGLTMMLPNPSASLKGQRSDLSRLSEGDRQMLLEQSAISPEIVTGRGYWTAKSRADVPDAFPDWQRRRGLVIPTYSPSGASSYQLRPEVPRKRNGKIRKYEQPSGLGCILDVHPFYMEAIRDARIRLWITEGCKKGDSLASRGECVISLSGVWNWQRDGEPLTCWEYVPLHGREVYVVFDNDVMVKPEVQQALERLVSFLEGRGATARVVYLPGVVGD